MTDLISTQRDARLLAGYHFDHHVDWPLSDKGEWIEQNWKSFEVDAAKNAVAVSLPDSILLPNGFRWIGTPCKIKGGDYEYDGRLLFSFPKDIGGPIRYLAMDENRRLFIHNGVQVGIDEPAPALDEAFFADFTAWNLATFGPGMRTEGTIKHIQKELKEIEADPTDPKEWVDIGILAFNGLVRLGLKPVQIIAAFLGKHSINKARNWPDWRNHPDTPIEHDRSGE